jgi:hypothetical protein
MPKKIEDWGIYGYSENEWKLLTKSQRYKIRHPNKVLEAVKAWQIANKEYCKTRQRKYWLRDKYGITEEEYNAMFTAQNGKCAICLSDTETGKWKRFCVDHCHTTGRVRGLLCNECNRGIGLLKDNPTILTNAVKYLTKEENEQRKSTE